MAIIQNSAIIQKLVDELELSPSLEKIPTELADKVLPVFQVNSEEIEMKPEGTLRYLKSSAAGNVILTATAPVGKKWRLDMFSFKLATDATVANRAPRVNIKDDSGNLIMEAAVNEGTNPIFQVASKTFQYVCSNTDGVNAGAGVAGEESSEWAYDESATITSYNLKLPLMLQNLILLAGWTINIEIQSGVAGDTTSCFMMVNESNDESTN